MSAPKAGHSIPPVRLAAMWAVQDDAARHIGDRQGFDCLLGFLTLEQAGLADPGLCWSLFLEPAELVQRVTSRYASPEARRRLTLILLRRGMQAADQDTVALASRIVRRIETPRADGASPWPLLFLDANADGVATAIAVHDSFWTGDWDQWELPSSCPSGSTRTGRRTSQI
jgi:hypothetical protein